ncbi:hypothetical protein GWI34_29255 [Actinomadura sp. DSM 109109]|nr:hypothetical protein [Actinomadura lepetitiana]
MRRSWSIAAAANAAGCLSFAQWLVGAAVTPTMTAFRYGDAPVPRIFSFFAPMTPNDTVGPHLQPWLWPLRVAVYLLAAALVYLATRSVTTGTGLTGAVLRWTSVVMLAFGAGEAAALAIVIAGAAGDPAGIPLEVVIDTRWSRQSWPSDALFTGAGMAAWIGFSLAGLYLAHRRWHPRPPGAPATIAAAMPGRARHVATVGVIPAVCLAFAGGATPFVSARKGISLHGALSNISLYPRLRPEPPPTATDDWLAPAGSPRPMDYSGIRESWPVSTAVALVFLALLWLLLWRVVSGMDRQSRHGTLHAFLFGWSLVVLTGALTGLFHALLTRLTSDFGGFGTHLTTILPAAMRFGVAWGWLVGLAVAFSYRRSRPPAEAGEVTDISATAP